MITVSKVLDMEKEVKGKIAYLKDFKRENTVIVVVDMVNGFVYEGILSSPRIVEIIKPILELDEKALEYNKIYFVDQHDEEAVEYKTYATHCIKGSQESELIPELKERAAGKSNVAVIPKNSTNGFHAPGFKSWLKENEERIENYIVVGCEADICVNHFATTLKTYFNEKNLERKIIVPANCVETYDLGTHEGDLMKVISLYEMQMNGIEIVDKIK